MRTLLLALLVALAGCACPRLGAEHPDELTPEVRAAARLCDNETPPPRPTWSLY